MARGYILTTSGTHERLYEDKGQGWWLVCFREVIPNTSEYGDWRLPSDPMSFEPEKSNSYHWTAGGGHYGYKEDEFSVISKEEALMIKFSADNGRSSPTRHAHGHSSGHWRGPGGTDITPPPDHERYWGGD